MIDPASIPTAIIDWKPAHRVVPSRFPPIGPWDRIARPEDFAALAELEGLTNPRIREEIGALSLIPRDRWAVGAGSTPIMAAFTHLNPEGSRFSNGSFGVLYVGKTVETAIKETVFHRERFLQHTRQPPLQIQMRRYVTTIKRSLHDVRGGFPTVHDPYDYSASRQLGQALRASGADGLAYDSVRNRGGQCAALFWPDCVAPFIQATHYGYVWDGKSITNVIELTRVPL
ncbi:MAG TPA: RES family NAD+ phosphorylase [Woeseiaceae bacterium]|nr:RES family NAD+ phosphorylase [Woeseiaceae bacterium]